MRGERGGSPQPAQEPRSELVLFSYVSACTGTSALIQNSCQAEMQMSEQKKPGKRGELEAQSRLTLPGCQRSAAHSHCLPSPQRHRGRMLSASKGANPPLPPGLNSGVPAAFAPGCPPQGRAQRPVGTRSPQDSPVLRWCGRRQAGSLPRAPLILPSRCSARRFQALPLWRCSTGSYRGSSYRRAAPAEPFILVCGALTPSVSAWGIDVNFSLPSSVSLQGHDSDFSSPFCCSFTWHKSQP